MMPLPSNATLPNDTLLTPVDAAAIAAALLAHKLEVRNVEHLLKGMVTASQPLSIDGVEICADTVLAEVVTYATLERGQRELETLTLKKTSFSDVESTMTPIPKYCFGVYGGLGTIFVHPVPRWSLDDILTAAERTYGEPYTYDKMLFVTDWVRSIQKRVIERTAEGRGRWLRMVAALPGALEPPPPHIPSKERRAFAARILATVGVHHRKGIYHDGVSSKTIFFRSADQVQLLANYGGVPKALLADELPTELLADDADVRYGAHCRDVYALALICYRIVTGEKIDGRLFSVEAPRPFLRVIEEMVGGEDITVSFKTFTDVKHTASLMLQIIGGCIQKLPLVFAADAFVAWRKLNRATGGAWRVLPVVGHLCDIVAPAPCAAALRTVLDKQWFTRYLLRTGPAAVPDAVLGPHIDTLITPFSKGTRVQAPLFGALFRQLSTDSSVKRQLFGSLMEVERRAKRFVLPRVPVVPAAVTGGVLLVALLIVLLRGHVLPTAPEPAGAVLPLQQNSSTAANVAAVRSDGVQKEVPVAEVSSVSEVQPLAAVDTQQKALPAVAANAEVKSEVPQVRRRPVRRAVVKPPPPPPSPVPVEEAPAPPPPVEVVVTPPVPELKLVRSARFRGVLLATGSAAPCNPGILVQRAGLKAEEKLFMVHATSTGYGDIIPLYRCAPPECDSTRYFEAVGVNKRAKKARIAAGDAISASGYDLRLFLRDARSSQ